MASASYAIAKAWILVHLPFGRVSLERIHPSSNDLQVEAPENQRGVKEAFAFLDRGLRGALVSPLLRKLSLVSLYRYR